MAIVCGIYAVVHKPTGKRYVGSSKDVRRRLRDHRTYLKAGTHYCKYLQHAYDKYGSDAFAFLLLEAHVPVADLEAREQWWVDVYPTDMIYNTRKRVERTARGPDHYRYGTSKLNCHEEAIVTLLLRGVSLRKIADALWVSSTCLRDYIKKLTPKLDQETQREIATGEVPGRRSEKTKKKLSGPNHYAWGKSKLMPHARELAESLEAGNHLSVAAKAAVPGISHNTASYFVKQMATRHEDPFVRYVFSEYLTRGSMYSPYRGQIETWAAQKKGPKAIHTALKVGTPSGIRAYMESNGIRWN